MQLILPKGKAVQNSSLVFHPDARRFVVFLSLLQADYSQNAKSMNVQVNGEAHAFDDAVTLSQVLDTLGYQNLQGIAVAVNQEVSPKPSWDTAQLSDGDNVIIIKATQGG